MLAFAPKGLLGSRYGKSKELVSAGMKKQDAPITVKKGFTLFA